MTRSTFILSALAMLLGSCCLCVGLNAAVEIVNTVHSHDAVDTAIARGWLKK